MKNLIRKEKIDYDLDWVYYETEGYFVNWRYYKIPLSKIKKDLDKLEELGVTSVEFEDCRDKHQSINFNMRFIKEKEETDEEYNKRLEYIKEREEVIKKQELQQLEILRKKYNV